MLNEGKAEDEMQERKQIRSICEDISIRKMG